MSFSLDVKHEVAYLLEGGRHCRIAEIAAIINSCGYINELNAGYGLIIETDNKFVIQKAYDIFANDFKHIVKMGTQNKLVIDNTEVINKVLLATGILDKQTNNIDFRIAPLVVKSVCCKKAYIKSTFLTNGSISDPTKSYHLEFVFQNKKYAHEFSCLINNFELKSKVVIRKQKSYIVYLKEGEQIVDLLNIMGAYKSLLKLEDLRIEKEVSNNINRKVNFQSANLNKTISASIKQVEDIDFISRTKGLTYLSPPLEELARLRLEYPEITIKELGEKLSVPLGKSGVNHRLRKLSKIADIIRFENI